MPFAVLLFDEASHVVYSYYYPVLSVRRWVIRKLLPPRVVCTHRVQYCQRKNPV